MAASFFMKSSLISTSVRRRKQHLPRHLGESGWSAITKASVDPTVVGQVSSVVHLNLALLVFDGDYHVRKIQQLFVLQLLQLKAKLVRLVRFILMARIILLDSLTFLFSRHGSGSSEREGWLQLIFVSSPGTSRRKPVWDEPSCQSPAILMRLIPVILPSGLRPKRRLAASPRGKRIFTTYNV